MVQVLLHSLRKHTREHDRDSQMAYQHEHINVLGVSSLDQMFGTINEASGGDWEDGIFTAVMKKANQHLLKNKLTTWVTLDGPLHEEWCASMNGLFNREKVSFMDDGEHTF